MKLSFVAYFFEGGVKGRVGMVGKVGVVGKVNLGNGGSFGRDGMASTCMASGGVAKR